MIAELRNFHKQAKSQNISQEATEVWYFTKMKLANRDEDMESRKQILTKRKMKGIPRVMVKVVPDNSYGKGERT